ncbi:hypothetical protein [Limnoglobus roseus]|uniref:Uncharacterized protein n=1 Tax=Limnoglobus roseus TaxID=2598579 RepID=A0A5C1AM00_9BACT|nr:hypothetical protein [Limnoglobus roseus]QEL17938.1 hypothetical protein PX52LOC_04951 [Limnoglobus roseus]
MSQLSENAIAHLDAAQAQELVRVMELQAFWENLRETVGQKDLPTSHLKDRQKSYEAYRSRLAAYTTKYRTFPLPELTQNSPKWVAQWFRVVKAILQRTNQVAGNELPVHLMLKAHRLADRIAVRLKKSPLEAFTPPTTWEAAVLQLDALIVGSGEQVQQQPSPVEATQPDATVRTAA